MTDHEAHMRHALQLAARGLGRVWPNPAVGCVLVKAGRIVGRGWTQPGGRPHAERMALDQAGARARGALAYVTLEPCAHHGKTPPCAEALVAAGVSHVYSALTDPDPRVAGKGHALLRGAGIGVTEGLCAQDAQLLNRGFLKRVTQGLPFVTLKLATTLDGKIALDTGESRWITGPGARRAVHRMRMAHDAVMVGSGTALADDPDLTVRDLGAAWQPLRILVDGGLRVPASGRLGRTARAHPVWVLHAAGATVGAWQEAGAKLLEVAQINDHLDLRAGMAGLAAQGVTRVFCEGGAGLAAALIRAGLVDEVITFTAGAFIGAEGRSALGALGLAALSDAPRLRLVSQQAVGGDMQSIWRFA
ncbi:bifunctional diaminohydroxyphosphoribosylaminopyrimidine deaminase/5-amino-6-(5-phosphoribosylamino)uracil reductase RibD [Pseudorhodobacter sp. E13]|uniref:bifunctional diaminohydroxyphosphoribosylaminopyrimidine deaminase/5-amino-6-(5-phosphoribosylamino)uracil reductase RibD n=1 Tax=Pseudorhodobacter sp. E13 TaxID=2487931 RepID=UPI000F8E7377|nr:bifunctional diaminohydroxyphosphoribosylaminopyrimidine deaminase/5-amino-6-(5-phosphoribosylamino)uracil reductase RibD [Pseudorhodobacter sp. E13]RUS63341.1 bifunctional diaminohydroxyphosphoribosylaminopyrimidine deaminase/5-amino-6-(5-phosphoribosylamino)uracil reductase RibD [Pseudorhodobacter sp. E13]